MRSVLRALAKLLTAVGIVLVLLLCLGAGALWLTLPRSDQTAQIPGLSAPVEIGFDQDGIPRIRAANALDAAAAMGFVHARDRMFQMELMRRSASGRLSELAGPATLPLDRMMRTLGLRRHAVADLETLPADTRAMLDAYARGVNAWIALKGRFAGPEFLVLGPPEPWRPVDSLLWGKIMGMWLSSNWRTELTRLGLQGKISQQMIEELWPANLRPPAADAALAVPHRYADAAERLDAILPRFPAPFTKPSTASNEWAVDGRHTATGAPLLAGDPHLEFGFPGIWYLARIEMPGQVLAGATGPGVPFLVIGHNGHIAWTFTTTGADVQDIFIETSVGSGEYQTPDGPKPFTVHEERIHVRGQPDETLMVRETHHGPVISDLLGPNQPLLAAAMANLQPNDTAAAGLLALNQAGTVADAQKAAPEITSPVQNLLVADAHGIGLFLTGRVPIRKAGDGFAPVQGADGAHDWVGWASGNALAHFVDPDSGRLVNTNEPVAPPGNGAFLGLDAFGDWRAQRVRALLGTSDRLTASDFARMQLNVQSTFAQQVLPTLLAVRGFGGTAAGAQGLLKGWDGTMGMDAPQPLIFNAWVDQFYRSVLSDAGLRPGQGGPLPDFVAFVLSPQGAHWCKSGDCNPALRAALAIAIQTLTADYGPDPAAWRWGDAHKVSFAHPFLSRIPVVGPLATMAIATPGADATIDAGVTNAAMEDIHGPSFRGVYDLSDLDRSLFVLAPGQSGNLLSRHARDFLVRWRDGATIALAPEAARTDATLHLEP